MLPKISKSQFRTPFRGDTARSHFSEAVPSQSQEPLLATTPNLGIACSQMSTPGITIDALKALIRKPPSTKKTVGGKVINKKLPSKNTLTKKPERSGSTHPVQRKSENDDIVTMKTDSVSRRQKRTANEGSDGYSKVKNRCVAPGIVKDYGSSERRHQPEAMAYTCQSSDCETFNQDSDESQVIPVQMVAADNKAISKRKVKVVRKNPVKTLQSSIGLNAPVTSLNAGKYMVKKRIKRNRILEKWYPSHKIHSNRDNMMAVTGTNVDHVVVVREDDYVYRDVIEEPVCVENPIDSATGADVFLFTSTSAEEQTTLTSNHAASQHVAPKRWRRDQVISLRNCSCHLMFAKVISSKTSGGVRQDLKNDMIRRSLKKFSANKDKCKTCGEY